MASPDRTPPGTPSPLGAPSVPGAPSACSVPNAPVPSPSPPPPTSVPGWPFHAHAWRIAAIVAAAAAVLVPHYATPVDAANMAWHEVHRHMLYLPILLAAIWYGWRGGLIAAIFVCLTFFPHLLPHWAQQVADPHAGHAGHAGHMMPAAPDESVPLAYILAALTYLLAGGGTGWLIGRLRREQQRLRELNARLTDQTREVFAIEEQLRRADRLAALGHLTAGLAHEIRNPLASIKGAAEILGDPATPPPARAEFSGVIAEEAGRLDHVLGEFLSYARTQRAESAPSAAELPRVLERVLALLRKPLDQAGITVELNIPTGLPALRIAENLLQQVLLNLALNAVQAMPRGGTLRLDAALLDAAASSTPSAPAAPTAAPSSSAPSPSTVSGTSAVSAVPPSAPSVPPVPSFPPAPPTAASASTLPSSHVRISIHDTGPGIAPEVRARIFDPFYTTKPQGTGLGLSIAHKILSSCGGAIDIDPNATSGARFILTIPLA